MKSLLKFTEKGIYCPQGDFYIDPWKPVSNAVITHGHGDHARWGMGKYLCQKLTEPILRHRISRDIICEGIGYGETVDINGVKLSLYPAGHIIGSAQVRLEYKGYVSVISGDYKIQDDGLSTPFELVKCNEFVTESTFALPVYHWKSVPEINEDLQRWALRNRENGKTSVFIGYSLGKAQRILQAVAGTAQVFVHSSIAALNDIFVQSGVALPPYRILTLPEDRTDVEGQIVILPPALLDSNLIKKIPNAAVAICSGWMQVRGSRRWRSADAGFAVSDHADWDGLLQTVKATGAEKVFVTHGQSEIFARYLNEIGIAAQTLETHFGEEDEAATQSVLKNAGEP